MQTDATSLANNSQFCWMLHVASVCTPCCMLLDVVASCCAKFETGQTFSYVQTDATTPNNVGSCWLTVLHPFAHGLSQSIKTTSSRPQRTGYGLITIIIISISIIIIDGEGRLQLLSLHELSMQPFQPTPVSSVLM